jgi:hypothetical protein
VPEKKSSNKGVEGFFCTGRRAGELLKEMKAEGKLAKPKDTLKKGKAPLSRVVITEKLADLGVTPNQSSQWQRDSLRKLFR